MIIIIIIIYKRRTLNVVANDLYVCSLYNYAFTVHKGWRGSWNLSVLETCVETECLLSSTDKTVTPSSR